MSRNRNRMGDEEGIRVIAQLYLLVIRHHPAYDPQQGEYYLFISEEGARAAAMTWMNMASELYHSSFPDDEEAPKLLALIDDALNKGRYLDADDAFEVLADRFAGLIDRFYIEKVDLYSTEDVFLREGLHAYMIHHYMKGDETSSDYDVTLNLEEVQRANRGWLKDAYDAMNKWMQPDDLGGREYSRRMGEALASANFAEAWNVFWEWVQVGGNRFPDRIVVKEIPLRA